MGPGGLDPCGKAENCVQVCPKDIPLVESIAAVNRALWIHGVKRLFTGR
ncbi:MAG: hypothetical protein Kow0022_15010 [Phycisphaerales bacterium]